MPIKELLKPLHVGDLVLKNRIIMAPLTRSRAGVQGKRSGVTGALTPNDVMVEHYAQRASAGLIISEATAISDQGFGWYGAPGCYTDEHATGWKKVTDAVHAKGGLIFLQLWHMGRQSHSTLHSGPKETVSASAIAVNGKVRDVDYNEVPYEVPRALELEEIPGVVDQYRNSCVYAQQAGFDGVEIHGANGYLVDQFLNSRSNKRSDAYGSSVENRCRFMREVIQACLKVFPASRVGIRLSPHGLFGDMGSPEYREQSLRAAEICQEHKLCYVHVMDGIDWGWTGLLGIPGTPVTTADIKAVYSGPVIGNLGWTKDTAEGAIRSGGMDAASFGRLFISNPDLVERFTNDWPYNAHDYSTHYGDAESPLSKGYNDYPVYVPSESK